MHFYHVFQNSRFRMWSSPSQKYFLCFLFYYFEYRDISSRMSCDVGLLEVGNPIGWLLSIAIRGLRTIDNLIQYYHFQHSLMTKVKRTFVFKDIFHAHQWLSSKKRRKVNSHPCRLSNRLLPGNSTVAANVKICVRYYLYQPSRAEIYPLGRTSPHRIAEAHASKWRKNKS